MIVNRGQSHCSSRRKEAQIKGREDQSLLTSAPTMKMIEEHQSLEELLFVLAEQKSSATERAAFQKSVDAVKGLVETMARLAG